MEQPVRVPQVSFTLFGVPFAWRCSVCSRLFVLPSTTLTNGAVEEVNREFKTHLCWSVFNIQGIEQLIKFDKRPESWLG